MEVKFLTRKNIVRVLHNIDLEEKIVLPYYIHTIGAGTFSDLRNLKTIKLNDGLSEIGYKAFANSGIENIVIPPSVVKFNDLIFQNCKNLKKVKFLNYLERLSWGMFQNCENLSEIEFPCDIEKIGAYAFNGCKSLKYLSLPDSVKEINSFSFSDSGLECFSCSSDAKIQPNTFVGTKLKYLYKTENQMIFSQKPINFINVKEIYDFTKLENFRDFDIVCPILFEKNKEISNFIDKIYKEKLEFPFVVMKDKFEKDGNFNSIETLKWYKMMSKQFDFSKFSTYELIGLCKIGEKLGLFKKPVIETRISKSGKEITETVDYGQKSYEFLRQCLDKRILKQRYFEKLFIEVEGPFNAKLAKFFMNEGNLIEMLNQDAISQGFIRRLCNEFDEVQKYNTSNNAQVRNLAPTIEKFIEYFKHSHFVGVNDQNFYIADEVGKHFSDQKDFDIACEIMNKAKDDNVPHGLLKKNIKECFALYGIKKLLPSIKNDNNEAKRLTELNDKTFRYEWFDKHDVKNLTLGKYCTCCAHLEGAGFGIMSAGVLSPDVQNLVFKDEKGNIIGKSTLYINKEEGYGIFNNVEINNSIPFFGRNLIYKKFKEACFMFVKHYNIENPDNPIKKINVGTSHNDLGPYISNNDKVELNLLEPIDYGKFSFPGKGKYAGDSSLGQYTIWEASK